ncbi:MFS transporter [Vibrio salinus]|uniref:MFS transporter n=1 Tax=Vibrio salinus TaxID=2899784 RepID=UPI001E4887F6|nr:MFS transporter [Vibrio salinus]MCE0494843.1 MFS transporter [Vibrio salinus]
MKNIPHFSRFVISVCLCSVVTFSNIYWLQPLLPVLQREFQISSLSANLAMSAPLLGMGLGLLIFASWSDAIGRCKILLSGTAIGLMISFTLPLVQDYQLFLSLRFLQGVFLSVCPALAVPLLGEELRKSWLAGAVGFYVASNTVGGLSSRLLGGVSSEYLGGWANAGYVIAGISLILFTVIFFLLPKQKHFKPAPLKISHSLKAYGRHLKKPQLLILYLLIGLAFGTFVNLSNYLMIVLDDFPYNLPSDIRSLMFLTLLGGTTSSSLAGKFARKHSQIAGIIVGISIMLVANFLMSWSNIYTMVIGMVMISIGFFFCHAQASTLIGRSVTTSKGSAQALYSLFYYSGASFGVFFLEPFYKTWGWQGVLGATRIALTLCILLIVLYQLVGTYNKRHSHALS